MSEQITLQDAEQESHRARMALWKLESEWSLVKEQGGSMPEDFWAAFGKAKVSVSMAERQVSKLREQK